MPDQFSTGQELGAILRVTDQAIYKWIRQGKIGAVRFGRSYRIPAAEMERVLRESIPEDDEPGDDVKEKQPASQTTQGG